MEALAPTPNHVPNPALNRRELLAAGGALVIAVALPIGHARAQGPAPDLKDPKVDPGAFIRIAPDSTVTVLIKHLEMGQGPNTGLATLVAEELDANWSQMRAESAPGNVVLYANLMMGFQLTGGSTAMANSYYQMRKAGALAREMLVAAAARKWRVPASDVTVRDGVIAHAATGRTGRFGEFAADAAKLTPPREVKLKDAKDFRLIGRVQPLPRLDSPAKSDGTAKFAIDIHQPDMLTVVVAHPPRFGATLAGFDGAAAMRVPGVVAVKRLGAGVAVYARGMWPALQGRRALELSWDASKAEPRGTEEMLEQYRALARNPGKIAAAKGDAAANLAPAAGTRIVEAEYSFPYLAHAPMEPMDGYIEWDGARATARFGSQAPTLDQPAMAKTLGLTPDKVAIEVMYAGGSFGRRAQADAAFAIELAEVARAGGKGKYKLVYTREDDIQGGYYRPVMHHRLRAAVRDGRIVAWDNVIAGQSFAIGTAMEPMMVKDGVDSTMVEGSSEPPYAIANFRCSAHTDTSPVPTLWWRSVGHTHTGYAVECFVDQALVAAGKDPVEGRLEMMAGHPRHAGVLRAVAKAANWGAKPPKGRARGVAVVESFGSFVAQIAEVSLNPDGSPRVHKVWCAVDCGIAVNPDVIRAQMEGGIGWATGHALYGEVPVQAGAPTASNFHDYRSLRINEMPEVEVVIVPSAADPTGVGEPGVPPAAPAIANALAALGRPRPGRLPMVRRA